MNKESVGRLYLAVGAFGGELLLLLALPAFGRRFGHAAVALVGVAVVVANCGKLLGCLKIDAAITNVDAHRVGAIHAVAVSAAAVLATVLAGALGVLTVAGVVSQETAAIGVLLCVTFGGGAVQQATTMRLLRDDRLPAFAIVKSLPSMVWVALVLGLEVRLLPAYALAFVVTALAVAVVYVRWPRIGLKAFVRTMYGEMSAVRPYIVYGAPASALDAGNLLLLSLLTLELAGTQVAGQATQLQRLSLAPALAMSVLLSQQIWRQRFGNGPATAARASFAHTVRWAMTAGLLSVGVTSVLVFTRVGSRVVSVRRGEAFGVVACLAPLLAQYVGSPLTVYFFKRERMALYAGLQIALLACLAAASASTVWLPHGHTGRPALLVALGAASLTLTVFLSRYAIFSVRKAE